MFPARVENSLS